MSNSNGVLKPEEITFLLDHAQAEGQDDAVSTIAPESQEISLRGNLEQMSLTDIFQTLALSKAEGTLRIRTPLEQREVLFREGMVRCFTPTRVETRRLGHRLVREGHITHEQLRAVLVEQRQTRAPLGTALVEAGALTPETIESVLRNQSADDLYAVFTWRHGTFEFYRGPSLDPVAREQLQHLPEFDVNGVLLEVARRSDDWERITVALRTMDEVPQRIVEDIPADLPDDETLAIGAIDATMSIRELADVTMLGVFECARAVFSLDQKKLVEIVSAERMIEIAGLHIERGDLKRALVTVQTIHDRPQIERSRAVLSAEVDILQKCGESKLAGRYLLEGAQNCSDPNEAIDLARRARTLDPHSIPVLELLRSWLFRDAAELDETGKAELVALLGDLADAQAEENKNTEALATCSEIATLDPSLPANLMRKARLLHKLTRSEEAVEVLPALAATFKATKRTDRLAQVYEQILKIDYRRRDIGRALKSLHASWNVRLLRHGVAAATVLAIGLAGLTLWSSMSTRGRIREIAQSMAAQIESGGVEQAVATLEAAIADLGSDETLVALHARASEKIARLRERTEQQLRSAEESQIEAATALFENGELAPALQQYSQILTTAREKPAVEQVARTRLAGLLPRLDTLAKNLPFLVPQAPDPLQSEVSRAQIRSELAANFKAADERMALGVIAATDDPILAHWLGRSERDRLIIAAQGILASFRAAHERVTQYDQAQARIDAARRLDPILLAAREHESKHEFAKALENYRQLAAEHTSDDELEAHFQAQVQRYATILRFLQVIEKATRDGDFASAQGQLRALKRSFPQIPFESLAKLPLRVETLPPGATVLLDGSERGRTPLSSSYSPAGETRVRVELTGFVAEEVTLKGDGVGLVRSLLAKRPDWQASIGGTVERTPGCDAAGHVFLVDRSGNVTALEQATGAQLWVFKTKELSGLLTTPLVTPHGIVVASADGIVRCLDPVSGELRWQKDDLATESTPALCGERVVVATVGAQVCALDVASGEIVYKRPLPGPVRAPITAFGNSVLIATTSGVLLRVHAHDGSELWRQNLTSASLTAPVVTKVAVIVAADDGILTALGIDDGHRIWRQTGLGELTLRPVVTRSHVIVAEGKGLVSFGLADGVRATTFESEQLWSSEPAICGDHLLIGQRNGSVLVLEPSTLQVRYRVRGAKPSLCAPLAIGDGKVVIGFSDRQVCGYSLRP